LFYDEKSNKTFVTVSINRLHNLLLRRR